MEEQNLLLPAPENKSKYWKFAVGFLVIIILVGGGYFVWGRYLSPQARYTRQTQENYEKYLGWQKNFETAMKNDTYGGKTPEETLKMFIDALRKDDVELASKYFILETNTNDSNYLTRKKWEDALIKAKNDNRFAELITLLSQAKSAGSSIDGYYGFEVFDESGSLVVDINLQLNKYSSVWKIESL